LEKQNKTAIFTNKGTTSSTEHRPKLPRRKPPGKKEQRNIQGKMCILTRQGKARQPNFHDQEKKD